MTDTAQLDRPVARSAAQTLDPATLDANTMSNKQLQRELFDLYFGQAPEHLNKMRGALDDPSGRDWKDSAHALKGTARTLGLMRLAEAATLAEASAPAAAPLGRLNDEYAMALSAAYAYLASSGGA